MAKGSKQQKLDNVQEILALEQTIKEDKLSINKIQDLLNTCKESDNPAIIMATLKSAFRIFVHFFQNKQLLLVNIDKVELAELTEAKRKVTEWLYAKYREFISTCVMEYIECDEEKIQLECLEISMQLMKEEYRSVPFLKDQDKELTKLTKIATQEVFRTLLSRGIVGWNADDSNESIPLNKVVLNKFRNDYVQKYEDIKMLTFETLSEIVKQFSKSIEKKKNQTKLILDFSKNVIAVIDKTKLPAQAANITDFYLQGSSEKPKQKKQKTESVCKKLTELEIYKKAFTKFWFSFLQIPNLPKFIYQLVLFRMDEFIIPNIESPFLMNDFIIESFNKGGYISLLSVKSLFTLISKYNLVYPDFYKKLYSILSADMFMMKNREEFCKLLVKFMSSSLLPEYIVGAFAKKLARVSLTAPPHAAIFIIVFIHDLLLRHPEIRVLVHRSVGTSFQINSPLLLNSTMIPNEEVWKGIDPFLPDEEDLQKCNALKSTLWELEALIQHYNPIVGKYAAMFKAQLKDTKAPTFPKPDEFVEYGYAKLFDEEMDQIQKARETEPSFDYRKGDGLYDTRETAFKNFAL